MRVCVFVETFGIFTYIRVGMKGQNNLIPHLLYCQPLVIVRRQEQTKEKCTTFHTLKKKTSRQF